MFKPLVIIPSYNSGQLLKVTVEEVMASTDRPAWVVIDGSDDGSESVLLESKDFGNRLKVIINARNEGKGAAVRSGLEVASQEGYTHALVMDADGQHPAGEIGAFFNQAAKTPDAMILGQPVFGKDVPWERLYGRKLSVWLVRLEILSRAIGDPLFGFRVYPINALLEVMAKPNRSNRYDFDPEVAVRMYWNGVPAVKVPAPVAYIEKEQGGISHFHYLRDNLRFIALHLRLIIEAPFHWIAKLL